MALKTAKGFTTGLAQPQQPQSQGTPYNPHQGQPFGAWSPQPAGGLQGGTWGAIGRQPNPFGGSAMPAQPAGPPASWGQPIHGQQVGSQFPMPQPSQAGPPGWSPQPGSQAVPGPVPGTTMFRPPMNQPQGWEPHHFLPRPGEMLAPSQVPQPGGGRPVSQPGQRTPITQGPAPRPGGITQDQIMQRQYGDFWNQAQQMFPTMTPGQQQEMARFLKEQQQRQNQAMIDQARQAGMNQWHADQAAAGQNIQAAPAAAPAPRPKNVASRPATQSPPASAGPQAASITGQPEPGKKGTPPRGGPAQSATAGPDLGAWYDKMVSDGRPPAAAGALASQASYYAKNWHMSDNEREMYWQLVQGGTRPSDAVGQAREYYRRRPA